MPEFTDNLRTTTKVVLTKFNSTYITIYISTECILVHEMLKSVRYHKDRADLKTQKVATTAGFIHEE